MVRVVKQAILPSIICFLLIKCKIIIKPDVGLCAQFIIYRCGPNSPSMVSIVAEFTSVIG